MKSELKPRILQNLIEAYRDKFLKTNSEYQRGLKWTPPQRQGLIDSILRGYQLPLFYFHLEKQRNPLSDESEQTTFWIVDGQQRLAAIVDYYENKFALPDPAKKPGMFIPSDSVRTSSWAGKRFQDLELADKDRILNYQVHIIYVTADSNEVRELFIRLQGGTPLTAQEKRDAWPGDFTNFVIRNAGKPEHDLSKPLPYFDQFKKSISKRISIDDNVHFVDGLAERRKFFAGVAMTIMIRERFDTDFLDIKGKTINDFYLANLNLPSGDPGAERVVNLLNQISELPNFEDLKKGTPMTFQMAFHFTLLVDSLNQGNYTADWKGDVVIAFLDFKKCVADARLHYRETRESIPHYENFGRLLSGSGSDTAETIRVRHAFLLSEMCSKITLVAKDPNRRFDPLEREVIWNRDRGRCQNPDCPLTDKKLQYRDAEVHHIVDHSNGGNTALSNGVLVCNQCHRNRIKMQELADYFQKYIENLYSKRSTHTPSEKNADDSPEKDSKNPPIRIVINWKALNVARPTLTISKSADSKTILETLRLLLIEFGNDMEEQLKSQRIINYPLSTNPESDFMNPSTGRPYGYRRIDGTNLLSSDN